MAMSPFDPGTTTGMKTETKVGGAFTRSRSPLRGVPAGLASAEIALLVLLFCAGALAESVKLKSVSTDVWMHLRAGTWILQHHSIPRTGLFSQIPDSPWVDGHWLYQVLLGLSSSILGLRAIPFVAMLSRLLLGVCTFRLARSRNAPFPLAIVVSGLALLIMDRGSELSLVSAAFFALELCIIECLRGNFSWRAALSLLSLLAVWANVDSGFIYGVLCVTLFAVASTFTLFRQASPGANVGKVWILAVAAAATTVISPYGFAAPGEAWLDLFSKTGMKHFAELQPMAFRTPMDFVALLFVMGSMTVLGFRRRYDLFQLSAIGIAMALGFRFQRDFWLVTLCCVAALADALGRPDQAEAEDLSPSPDPRTAILAATIAGFILVVVAMREPRDLNSLVAKAKANLPVAACDMIRSAQLPNPIFQSYQWGSFLAWYLPEQPVVIDNRVSLYGDERNERFINLVEGKTRVEQDPDFSTANTVLLEANSGLTNALLNIPQLSAQFRVVYQDDIAVVFVRR